MKNLFILNLLLLASTGIFGANVDFTGKINMGAWYLKPDRFYNDTINDSTGELGSDSMNIILSSWSPFGVFGVKYNNDVIGGYLEMGAHLDLYDTKSYAQSNAPKFQKKTSDYMTLEKWYAEWYINESFTFQFGKDYTPTNFFPSNQMLFGGENGSRGYGFNNVGCLYTGAYPMIQLKYVSANETFEGKVAAIKIDPPLIPVRAANAKPDKYQTRIIAPKFEGGIKYSIEKGKFSTYGNFAGGYQTFESVLFRAGGKPPIPKDSCYLKVSSYVAGADLGVKVGLVSLAIDAFYGQNIGVYGVFVGDKFGSWRTSAYKYMKYFYPEHIVEIDPATKDSSWILYNSSAFEFATILTVRPTEFLAFQGGMGMVFGSHEYEEYDSEFSNTLAWYFQTEFKILEMLKVTPEVGQYDYGPLAGFGKYFYWGLNTGIEF